MKASETSQNASSLAYQCESTAARSSTPSVTPTSHVGTKRPWNTTYAANQPARNGRASSA